MEKRFLYNFAGTILVTGKNEEEVEKLVTGIDLDDYILEEDIFQIDEEYIATDLDKRKKQLGTELHPMDDFEDFEDFQIRKEYFNPIFNDFLDGKIDKEQLIEKVARVHINDIIRQGVDVEISYVDLETKTNRTIRLLSVS